MNWQKVAEQLWPENTPPNAREAVKRITNDEQRAFVAAAFFRQGTKALDEDRTLVGLQLGTWAARIKEGEELAVAREIEEFIASGNRKD